jgi:hypothetical protein
MALREGQNSVKAERLTEGTHPLYAHSNAIRTYKSEITSKKYRISLIVFRICVYLPMNTIETS